MTGSQCKMYFFLQVAKKKLGLYYCKGWYPDLITTTLHLLPYQFKPHDKSLSPTLLSEPFNFPSLGPLEKS